MATRRSGRGVGTTLINILSLLLVVFILLTIAGAIAVIAVPDLAAPVTEALGIAAEPEEEPAGPTPTLVAIAVVPTATATPTSSGLLNPTWTPQRPEATAPPTATNTRRPTVEPSITVTLPPATNTPTITPSPDRHAGAAPHGNGYQGALSIYELGHKSHVSTELRQSRRLQLARHRR